MCWVWDEVLQHLKKKPLPMSLLRDIFAECDPDDYVKCQQIFIVDDLALTIENKEIELV
jgi:hypothetical protein